MSIGDEDLTMLSGCTEGYSGSDLAHVASDALLRPLRELEAACYWMPAADNTFQPCSPNHPGALPMKFSDLSPHQVCIICKYTYYDFTVKSMWLQDMVRTPTQLR